MPLSGHPPGFPARSPLPMLPRRNVLRLGAAAVVLAATGKTLEAFGMVEKVTVRGLLRSGGSSTPSTSGTPRLT